MSRVVNISNDKEQIESEIKKNTPAMSIKQARAIASGYISEINRSKKYNEDNFPAREALYELIRDVLEQERLVGSPDDFHNLVASLGGGGFDELACEVLDSGLARFPLNVDLLADYLIYGIDSENIDACKKHYETLSSIPMQDWTWRCFSFQIAFLRRLKDFSANIDERNEYDKRIAAISKAYKKYLPNDEGGYRESAKLHSNNPIKELQLLNETLANEMVGACPSCAFRCADILFEQKKYHEALEAIKRSQEDSINQKQGGIDDYALYFLSGLCKTAIMFAEKDVYSEEEVLNIYMDFNIALIGITGDYCDTVRKRVQIIEQKTGIRVPEECEKILELIGY